jgi:hypothetical protein
MITFKPIETPFEWDWIKKRTHILLCEDMMGIVAYETDNGNILAACAADSFVSDKCNVHVAIDNPLVIRHGFLKEAFEWLFVGCGRKFVLGLVPSYNEKALKFDQHIGFREINRIPDAFGTDVDCIVLRMDAHDCHWLLEEAA